MSILLNKYQLTSLSTHTTNPIILKLNSLKINDKAIFKLITFEYEKINSVGFMRELIFIPIKYSFLF
jgi:hypothetical protein